MSENNTKNQALLTLCEGAVCVALAVALSYLKIKLWANGGSIDLVMVPLLVFACRRGFGWGVLGGLVFGTIKCFLSGAFGWGWQSILLDYVVAYAAVGLGGLVRRLPHGLTAGAVVGGAARFVVHYISGVTIYAILAPTELFGMTFTSPSFYSLAYNGSYMLVNTLLAAVVCFLLEKPMARLPKAE